MISDAQFEYWDEVDQKEASISFRFHNYEELKRVCKIFDAFELAQMTKDPKGPSRRVFVISAGAPAPWKPDPFSKGGD